MRASVISLSAGAALLLLSAVIDGQQSPIVYTATVDGIIHPVSCGVHAIGAIEKADAAGAALIVFTLHTPGGLLDSTRDINNAIIAREDAGRRVRRPGGQPRRLGRLPDHHRRRRRRHGARHAHRRRASGLRQRREGRRDDGEEDDVRHRAAYARTLATQREAQRRAGRAGGHREPLVHRAGSAQRQPAAHRPRRHRRAGPAARSSTAGRSRASTAASQTLHTAGASTTARRDDLAAADPERDRASADRVPAADARHARAHDRVVEPRRDPPRRRRRHLPAAGVLRAPGAAGELRRRPADPASASRCWSSR